MRRILAGSLTVIIMGSLIWNALCPSAALRPSASSAGDESVITSSRFQTSAQYPDATACIERLLESARKGDVFAYLNAFGGPLRERLLREADERGRDAFALRLRRAGVARKSHAIFAPRPAGDRALAASITVESTFSDRLERQTFRLERADTGWLVTEVETASERASAKPIGALATYDEPEGAPVEPRPDETVGEPTEKPREQ
jgi:hypothetical protein